MNARSMMLPAAIVAIAALAVGCGGGGDSSTATTVTTSSLSKAAFVKKANGICERGRAKLTATKSLPEGVETTMVPALHGIVEEIRALGAPSGEEAEIEAFLTAMLKDTDALDEAQASITEISQAEVFFKDSAALAQKSGLTRCAFYARFSSS